MQNAATGSAQTIITFHPSIFYVNSIGTIIPDGMMKELSSSWEDREDGIEADENR